MVEASYHFEKSGFLAIAMVPTLQNPDHSKSDPQNVWILNVQFSICPAWTVFPSWLTEQFDSSKKERVFRKIV